MAKINFETKSDRELLILVAQQGNETVDHLAKLNATIVKHERRITSLETLGGCDTAKPKWRTVLKVNWQTITLLTSIVALIILQLADKL